MNSVWMIGFVLIHVFVVAIHSVLSSSKSKSSSVREWLHLERWVHLVSSFWLPLPFLTLKGVDRGEEKSELWFLITLHTSENMALLLSRWVYLPDYPLSLLLIQIGLFSVNLVALIVFVAKRQLAQGGWFVYFYLLLLVALNVVAIVLVFFSSPDFEIHLLAMDIGIMSTNLLGLALAVFFIKKLELYSELAPDNIPNLPSFGPEDVPVGPVVHQHQQQQEQEQQHQHEGSVGEQEEEMLAQDETELIQLLSVG